PHHFEHHRQTVNNVHTVVHHQNAASGHRASLVVAATGLLPLMHERQDDGQADDELAAHAQTFAAGLDAAAVHLDQPLDDGQPDPQPGLRLLQRPTHLGKHLEYPGQHVRRNADAGVFDAQYGITALALGGEPDAAAPLAVLGGVGEEVTHHLGQPG